MPKDKKLTEDFIRIYSKLCRVQPEIIRGILDRMEEWNNPESPVHAYLEALRLIPDTIRKHREKGFPEDVTVSTISDLGIWSGDFHLRTGEYGIDPSKLKWLKHQNHLQVIRIGRLQYMTQPCFGGKIKAFRHRKTGEIRLLAEGGLAMNADGQREDNADFRTVYEETDSAVSGNPVECGTVSRICLSLPFADWEKILEYGDPLYSVHIPADGPMIPEECLASLRDAAHFFDHYFPSVSWKGFWCHSWLLDPFLQTFLPETSNIVRFQKLGILYPVSGESEILSRLAPVEQGRGTRLRKQVESYLASGRRFHNGGWVLFRNVL